VEQIKQLAVARLEKLTAFILMSHPRRSGPSENKGNPSDAANAFSSSPISCEANKTVG
jgi:hypothetical protein